MRSSGFHLVAVLVGGLLAAGCAPMQGQSLSPGVATAQPQAINVEAQQHDASPATLAFSSSTDAASLPDAPSPATLAYVPDADGAAAAGGPDRHPGERDVTWKSLPGDFLHDQKEIWGVFPSQLARGHHWVPVLAVTGVTAGLIYADPHIAPYFRSHAKNIDKANDVFDPLISTGEVIAIPASLLAFGYARHDEYQVSTGLMAALAYGDSVVPNLLIKAITRRQRPSDIPTGGSYTGTFFNGGKSPLKGSSFPSGHATAAFSVATVVAYRYRNHKWVPPLVYGLATVIGLSRVTTQAHFASDVFLGSAIGYSVARFQTVRPQ